MPSMAQLDFQGSIAVKKVLPRKKTFLGGFLKGETFELGIVDMRRHGASSELMSPEGSVDEPPQLTGEL